LCGGRKPNRFGYSKFEQFSITCSCFTVGTLIVYFLQVWQNFSLFYSLCCLIGIGASAFGTIGAQSFIGTMFSSTDRVISDAKEITSSVTKTIGVVDDMIGNVKTVAGIRFVND
jgi:hypothetical protein